MVTAGAVPWMTRHRGGAAMRCGHLSMRGNSHFKWGKTFFLCCVYELMVVIKCQCLDLVVR